MNADIDYLIQRCDEYQPAGEASRVNPMMEWSIEPLRLRLRLSRQQFNDLFAHRVASEFLAGRISFGTADAAINCLHSYSLMGPAEELLDGMAWEVFLAFDAGEFTRPGEEGEDRVSKYTRPLLLKAIAHVRSGSGP